MYNGLVIKAGRFYPSSKKCSRCGDVKHNLKLQDRLFRCTCCGQWINRDLNAAINLETVGLTAYARGHCVKPIPAMAGGGSGGNSGNTERNVKSGVSSLEFT
jgi:transposase